MEFEKTREITTSVGKYAKFQDLCKPLSLFMHLQILNESCHGMWFCSFLYSNKICSHERDFKKLFVLIKSSHYSITFIPKLPKRKIIQVYYSPVCNSQNK